MTSRRLALACALLVAVPLGAQDGVGFRASLGADTVYVGEQATYQLTVSIPAAVRQRLRRNPEFVPPDARAMLVYDLPVPRAAPGGEGPEVHVFRRAIFPLTPGRYDIAAARLTFALPQSPSFFSREEERTLRSEAVSFVAIEPPVAGRPSTWAGAVGRWRVRARADAAGTRVGDPFVLALRVDGVGNATLLPRPAITIPWANVVAEDERVVLDSTPTTLGGYKEFTWLVTPRQAGTFAVPSLAFAFFDPGMREYQVARSDPIPVRVRPGDLVTIPPRGSASAGEPVLRPRAALEGARTVPVPGAWEIGVIALLTLLAPLPWVVVRLRERRPRSRRERTPDERLRDLKERDPGTVRVLLDQAVLRRTGVSPSANPAPGALAAALRREGVTETVAVEAERLRDRLDSAAYASGAHGDADLRDAARSLLRRIDEEARRRVGVVLFAVLAAAMSACAAVPPASADAVAAFAEGKVAYAGADYAAARDAFLRAANAAPRDVAAWANLGDAAWQASDTAAAVLGWQRALRLDPLDDDLRRRLTRVRAPQSRGVARVWPLPVLPLAAMAMALWVGGWGWAAHRRRRHRGARRAALVIVPATALAALAATGEWQSRARDLVVISTPTSLRALPALGAEPGAQPLVGEVARVRERRGVWLRIELEAGRVGWYPAEHTYPLERR